MRAIAIVLAVLAAAHCVAAARGSHMSWDQWKAHYKRAYTPAEDARRAAVYDDNMRTAAQLEARNPLAEFGVSPFADLTAAEFKSTYHNGDEYFKAEAERRRTSPRPDPSAAHLKAPAVQKIDWRTKGAVTYVKNQAQCGSCWSFSATGNIEGQWFLAGNKLVAVSEQELVSCDTTDSGCNGGLMDNAFAWLINNRGGWITGENDYPYVSGNGEVPACDLTGKPKRAQIASYHDVETTESAMAAFCAARGPGSIGVVATSFQTYSSGILTHCISQQVDHGVLIVGFDLTYSTPYWIIKNSWAASWGESGYIRVAYGSDQCLITSGPTSSKAASGTCNSV
jgi:C1A family cysteine protease